MTEKNLFFYKIVLKQGMKEIDYTELYRIYDEIFKRSVLTSARTKEKSLDLSYETNIDFRIYTMNILEFNHERLFCKIGKRKANNKMVRRNQELESEDVIDVKDQDNQWVEILTYFLIDFATGICATVKEQSAPDVDIINRILTKYNNSYMTEIIKIPNDTILNKVFIEGAELGSVAFEMPVPNVEALEKVFNLKDFAIGEEIKNGVKSVDIVLKAESRGAITKEISTMNKVRELLKGMTKAKVTAKAPGQKKMREYDLKKEFYGYPIKVSSSYKENGKEYQYSKEQMEVFYKSEMTRELEANKEFLAVIIDRYK